MKYGHAGSQWLVTWSVGAVVSTVLLAASPVSAEDPDDAARPGYRSRTTLETQLVMAEPRLVKKLTRWDKFEAEFGLYEPPSSPVLGQLADLKYGLDLATYNVEMFTRNLDDALEFRYNRGKFQRVTTVSSYEPRKYRGGLLTLDDLRLKMDVKLATGKPYLGVRVVVPFGD